MKTKRFILMLLVMLGSVTGAWAEQEVDYTIIDHSEINSSYRIESLKDDTNIVPFVTNPFYVVVDAQQAINLQYYILTPIDNMFLPQSVTVEGSNDKSSWTTLHSTGIYNFTAGTPEKIDIDCITQYRYYRFSITGIRKSLLIINQLQIYATTDLEGEGTTDNPYLIDGYLNWQRFHNKCATNPAACGKLTANIDMADKGWNPEGDFTYIGTVDGDNHIISNLSSSVGLFRNTGAATIKNLGLENCNISNTDANCGALASTAVGTKFINCYVVGNIISSDASANYGGLVGMASGNTQLTQCYCITGVDEIRPTFVSTDTPGHYESLDASKLVDDTGSTLEWCTPTSAKVNGVWNIVVSTGTPVKLNTIKLWNARNTVTNYGRTWKKVKVYGSNIENGSWGEPIGDFDNLNLAINNYGFAGELEINATEAYTYYKIDVLENKGGTGDDYMQMADMKFVVTSPQSLHLPVCGSSDGSCTANLCYHYGCSSSALSTSMEKEDITNGRLAYLLNNGNFTGPYFQCIGTDTYPSFSNTENSYVYLALDDATYTNACPHRDCIINPLGTPACWGADGNVEYGKCNNSLCGKYFPTSDRNAVSTTNNSKDFILTNKAVIIEEHDGRDGNGIWTYSPSKEINGTTSYKVMEVTIVRSISCDGNYEFFYTSMDDDPTMKLRLFIYSRIVHGKFSIRFYVNGTERPALRKDYFDIYTEDEIVTIDGLHKWDRINVVFNYNHEQPLGLDEYATLYVGTEKTEEKVRSHNLHKHELSYNCIDGGHKEYYQCEYCNRFLTQDTPLNDNNLTTWIDLVLAPKGAHNFGSANPDTQKDGNLYGVQCQNEHCTTFDPDKYVLRNYHNDTDLPLTYDGSTYSTSSALSLTDGKAYVTPVAFDAPSLTYSRYYPENVWSAWFTPFDVNASYLTANGLTPAYIEGIHNYDDNEDGTIDRTVMEIVKISNGRLRAGTPLLVRAVEGYSTQLDFSDVTMMANDDIRPMQSSTMTSTFNFIGTFTGTTAAADDNIYSLSTSSGALVHRTGNILPLRWYCQIEQKPSFIEEETPAPALARAIYIRVIGEEDQTTGIRTLYDEADQTLERADGIFDLSGRELAVPQHGKINIIKGKKQFVK